MINRNYGNGLEIDSFILFFNMSKPIHLFTFQVAKWRDLYGIDGIDLDIEEGAGSRKEAGPNMLYFVK